MSCANVHSDDEFADIPDEFSGIDFDTIRDLAPLPPTEQATTDLSRITSTAPNNEYRNTFSSSITASPQYSGDEKYDDAFFRELDIIEGRAQVERSRFFSDIHATCSTNTTDSPSTDTPGQNKYRKRHSTSPQPTLVKRGKKRSKKVREALEGIEDEITCPICCELFVAAHISNPCGHTLCGECGWQWISKNKPPTCAICRTALNRTAPIIPNIALDNTVEKHIEVLASNGCHEWNSDGKMIAERNARKEKWKNIAAERTARSHRKKKKKKPGRGLNVLLMNDEEILSWSRAADDDDDDETYRDSDVESNFVGGTRIRRSRRSS